MDTVHDLGGKQGFGPIDTGAGDADFAHDWERRMWGLAREGLCPSMTIDWFRHGLELMVPGDYLTYSYFQKWVSNYLMLMIDAGQLSIEEVLAGQLRNPDVPARAKGPDEIVEQVRAACTDFSRPAETPARFAIGASVRTLPRIAANHTRLPAYARDRVGEVISHHGAHLLADAGAMGDHRAEHLYTVAFSARELWGEEANPRDSVTMELWESYLVAP